MRRLHAHAIGLKQLRLCLFRISRVDPAVTHCTHLVAQSRAGQRAAGSLEFNAGVRNALGRAERLDVAAEWGSKGSNEYSVAVSQPRVGGQPVTVEARVAQLFRNFLRHSSFTEQLRQAAVTVSTCAMPHAASCRSAR